METAGIETVFQQFFDDGSRTLDDLASRNTAHHIVREDMDLGGTTGGGHDVTLQRITITRTPLRVTLRDVRLSNFPQLILGQLCLVRQGKLVDNPFKILLRLGEISGFSRREAQF